MMRIRSLIILFLLVIAGFSRAAGDEIEDSLAAKVDDLFMKASSGEIRFQDLVEPSRQELIQMGEKAVPRMLTKLTTEDARERQTVEAIFDGIGDPAVPALIGALNSDNIYQLRLAASSLGKIGNRAATTPLLGLFQHADHSVRSAAVTAIGEIADSAAVTQVIALLSDSTEPVRKSAAVALGRIGDQKAIDPLIDRLADPHFSVRYCSSESLCKLGSAAGERLLHVADSLSSAELCYALEIWGAMKYKKAGKTIFRLLTSEDVHLRGFSILALAAIDPAKAGKMIRQLETSETDLFVLSCVEKARGIIASVK